MENGEWEWEWRLANANFGKGSRICTNNYVYMNSLACWNIFMEIWTKLTLQDIFWKIHVQNVWISCVCRCCKGMLSLMQNVHFFRKNLHDRPKIGNLVFFMGESWMGGEIKGISCKEKEKGAAMLFILHWTTCPSPIRHPLSIYLIVDLPFPSSNGFRFQFQSVRLRRSFQF